MSECRRECAIRLAELRAVVASCAEWLSAGLVPEEIECAVCRVPFDWQSLAGETANKAVADVPQ